MLVEKRLYIISFIILSNISFSQASVLSATTSFLKLHDNLLLESRRLGMSQIDFFQDISKSSGISNFMIRLRMFHSVLLSRSQPTPITSKELFFHNSQRIAPSGMSLEEQISQLSSVSYIVYGCSIDYFFLQFDAKSTDNIENEIKKILVQIRAIISEYGPFSKLCNDLGLSKELTNTIKLIDESVTDISA